MKKSFYQLIAFIIVVFLSATPCIAEASTASTSGKYTGTAAQYQTMIQTSLISTGNNYRLKKAIEKAKKGKEVTIAYIGGSITEGAGATVNTNCYAYQSYLYFKNTYGTNGGSNVKFVNAGMGGTPSTLGVIRYNRDVTSNGSVQPDIVFVEFAVNDYQEATNGEAYESLVRNVLSASNKPAVVLLFSVFKSRWNMQDTYKPIGTYYNLPMISIKDAVVPELTAGRITDANYFYDSYHPTDFGHGIMSDCIAYLYSTVNSQTSASSDITIPDTAKIGKSYQGIKMVDSQTSDSNVSISSGGFNGTDTQLGTFLYATSKKTFPNNWKHTTTSGTSSFTMTLNCKNLLLVSKASSSTTFGTADIYVDGTLVKSISGYQSGGWNNPITSVVFKNDTAAKHTIVIKMASGSESKEFSILGFGYTK